MLNHAGVCMSYSTTWNYLRQLTTQARYSDMVREGHWIWVYDNLNMHQRVRHERTGELVQGTSTHTGIMIMPKMCTIIHTCTCTCMYIIKCVLI